MPESDASPRAIASGTVRTVRCWRLVKRRHADDAWDGEGAYHYGGRWNSRGTRVVYASESLSLALLEILVHLDQTRTIPDLAVFSVAIPSPCIEDAPTDLGHGESPGRYGARPSMRQMGDAWAQSGRSLALRVPSMIIPTEYNLVINPLHADFERLRIAPPDPFSFDQRLTGG